MTETTNRCPNAAVADAMLSAECQMPTLVGSDTLLDKAREGLIRAVKVPAEHRLIREASMTIALYVAAAVIMAVGSLYFAWRNRDFRKFLAGAFFVSSGILFYLYLADVSVHRPFHPLLPLFLF